MKNTNTKQLGRRGFLGALTGAGGGLLATSIATGLPLKLLLDPLAAHADALLPAKTLIVATSISGDPVGANVPGTYVDGAFHPASPAMAATTFALGGSQVQAAKPWAELASGLDASQGLAFLHHATHTPVHGELGRVQRLMGATEKDEMLVALLANELAPRLGSVQSDPVSLGATGGELLVSGGRTIANVAPTSVRRALGAPTGELGQLTTLRDEHIDRIYALYRERGTKAQLGLLDAFARTKTEARSIGQDLLARLDAIDDNDAENQLRCAIALAAMNIAPVISVHLPFGGDNHVDADLEREAEEQAATIPMLGRAMADIASLRASGTLKHPVVLATLNVFGRTFARKGTNGRDHNPGHHALVLLGEGVKSDVVGGLVKSGEELIASSFDSATGKKGGDVPFEETLASAGKTLGRVLGLETDRLDSMIEGGKVVQSVVG
jgi:uncharacterized protein (DUF1501 family)